MNTTPEQTDTDRLTAITARVAAASTDRWQPYRKVDGSVIVYAVLSREIRPLFTGEQATPQDAEFAAHARADVPWLLARLAAVTAERDHLAAQLHAWEGQS